jgi:hypothetical protein
LKVVRKETVYIYPDLTTSTSELELDTITIADNFDAEVHLAGWIDPDYSYIPGSTSGVEVQLRKYNSTYEVERTADASLDSGGIYRWNFGSIPSELIGGSGNAGTAYLRYMVKNISGGTVYTSVWEAVDVTTQGSESVELYGIPVAQNVRAARSSTWSSYFRVTVSWNQVPYSNSARYINIYRNGEYVAQVSNNNRTSYDDRFATGGPYTYQISVVNSRNTEGALSDASNSVDLPPIGTIATLTPNVSNTGTLSQRGEVDYYSYSVPADGWYSFQDGRGSGYINIRISIAVTGRTDYEAEEDDDQWRQYLYAGDEVLVAVRAYTSTNTGDYRVYFRSQVIPVAQNVRAERNATQQHPFQVTVRWDQVQQTSNASYIVIYRDGTQLTSFSNNVGYYNDTTAGAEHTYEVAVANSGGTQGARSTPATVSAPFVNDNLTPGNQMSGYLSTGEIRYYLYTISSTGWYYTADNGSLDVRIAIAESNGNLSENIDGSSSRYLFSGDQVWVAITPWSTSTYGNYQVSFYN